MGHCGRRFGDVATQTCGATGATGVTGETPAGETPAGVTPAGVTPAEEIETGPRCSDAANGTGRAWTPAGWPARLRRLVRRGTGTTPNAQTWAFPETQILQQMR